MENLPEIMTIEEVAQYLRVSDRTVYEWAQKGKIPAGKLGSIWRFKSSDVLAWVDKQLVSENSKGANFVPLMLQNVFSATDVVIYDTATKDEVLHNLIDMISEKPEISSKDEVAEGIFHRELLMSTGIGRGIAIPHVRLSSVKGIVMAVAFVRDGVSDYEALDDMPVHLVFMIVSRVDQHAEHLKLVSQLSQKVKDPALRKRLLESTTSEELFEVLTK